MLQVEAIENVHMFYKHTFTYIVVHASATSVQLISTNIYAIKIVELNNMSCITKANPNPGTFRYRLY